MEKPFEGGNNIVDFEQALKKKEQIMQGDIVKIKNVVQELEDLTGKLELYKAEAEKLNDAKSMEIYENDIFKLQGDAIKGRELISEAEERIEEMWRKYHGNEFKREMEADFQQDIEREEDRKFIGQVMKEIEEMDVEFRKENDEKNE